MIRELRPHEDEGQLARRFSKLGARAGSFAQLVFRCTEPRFATESDLLTGEGSRIYGGRWNPPRSFRTVYAAFSDVTALAEAKAHFHYYGLDPADALPRTLVAIEVRLSIALDLTSAQVRQALGISATRMCRDDWREVNRRGYRSLTQALGSSAYQVGLEGLIVPACDGHRNVVWFPDHLGPGSRATIRNVNKLLRI